jgi:hypothetical protein
VRCTWPARSRSRSSARCSAADKQLRQVAFDRAVADLAGAEGAALDPAERRVDFLEERRERPRLGSVRDDRFEPFAALQQLLACAKVVVVGENGFHDDLLSRRYQRVRTGAIQVLRSKC